MNPLPPHLPGPPSDDSAADHPVNALALGVGVVTVTIRNRPAANALDDATRQALLGALRAATEDPECAAIVLTGEGDTFCAGGDLVSMPTGEPLIRRRLGEMHEIVRLLHIGPKPVVAAVDGSAYGSGMSLAVACDYVVATGRARFGCSFGNVGLVADTGLAWTLPRQVGWRVSRRILLGGNYLDAEEALRIGLVDELVSPADLLPAAHRWATAFSGRAPLALAATRCLLGEATNTLDQHLDRELELQIALLASDDFAEGRSAFFERRPPVFGHRRERESLTGDQYPPEGPGGHRPAGGLAPGDGSGAHGGVR